MMQGDKGSLEMFWTFPPTAKARPEGVRRGCEGLGGWAATCGREDVGPNDDGG